MKKKYTFDKETSMDNEIREPAIEYNVVKSPCQYTVEEMRQKFDRAVKQVENGDYFTDEELDDFILS